MQNWMISSAVAMAWRVCSRIARVEKNDGMQVAVARVEDIADFEAVLFSDFIDASQCGGKFCSRNHAVLNVIRWREAADGAEGIFSALPQEIAFLRITSNADFTRMVHAANIGDFFCLGLGGFARAVDID